MLGSLAILMMGRKNLFRLSRFFLNVAQYDLGNRMNSNGELWLQKEALKLSNGPALVFDVGANQGHWTIHLFKQAAVNSKLNVHCFEPASDTYAILKDRLLEAGVSDFCELVNKAISDHVGKTTLYVAGPGLGINSLHDNFSNDFSLNTEDVDLETIDNYVEQRGIDHITMMKVDAEGHDLNVIKGAAGCLKMHIIDFLQFEYSWRWIDNRAFLKDVFDLCRPLGYEIGKVVPHGIEFYDHWDPILETFNENNYVVCKAGYRGQLKEIKWWKST